MIKAITNFIGEKNCANIFLQDLEEDRFIAAKLREKLVNLAADLPYKALKSNSILKSIVGGDCITVQKKFVSAFEIKPYSKMIFSCNRMPEVYDLSDGFFRKWIIIDFPWKITADMMVGNKEEEFKDEKSGILNWALDGLDILEIQQEFWEDSPEKVRQRWQNNPLSL